MPEIEPVQPLRRDELSPSLHESVTPEPTELTTGQPKITGYRNLSPEEIALMNTIKSLGNQVGDLINDLRVLSQIDQRWLSIATTQLQQGYMALTRAVAQPTSF